MKYLLTLIILTFVYTIPAQEPDRWHGLVLDESTPEQAIQILGQPNYDKAKEDKYMTSFNKKLRGDNMRMMHWKDTEGFKNVRLCFTDGKLSVIQLENPKDRILASAFVKAYPGIEFTPRQSGADGIAAAFNSMTYKVEADTPRGKIRAQIIGGQFLGSPSGVFRETATENALTRFKGVVSFIFIESSKVANKQGIDALK